MQRLVLIRHGETVGESSVRLYGRTDIEMSDAGREQMRLAGGALAGGRFDAAYASPMKRSVEAARLVLRGVSGGAAPEPLIVDGFREIDFGDWEGWTLEEAERRDPDNFAKSRTQGMEFCFPGGDTRQGFFERAAAAGRGAFSAPDARWPAVAVLHKGVIKAILAELLGISFEEAGEMPIELGSIHRLEFAAGRWHVASANETDHLGNLRIPGS